MPGIEAAENAATAEKSLMKSILDAVSQYYDETEETKAGKKTGSEECFLTVKEFWQKQADANSNSLPFSSLEDSGREKK